MLDFNELMAEILQSAPAKSTGIKVVLVEIPIELLCKDGEMDEEHKEYTKDTLYGGGPSVFINPPTPPSNGSFILQNDGVSHISQNDGVSSIMTNV